MAHYIQHAACGFYRMARILAFVKVTDLRVHSRMVEHQLINRTRKRARPMKAVRQIFLLCVSTGFGLSLLSCAGPMNDPAGKHIYDEWVAQTGWARNPPADAAYAEAQVTDSYVFRMKAVKDYEYGNYVTNLRRGTSWGEFASDSVKITLDSLIAVTGGVGTKAALGAASAGVTGATTSIKKNVLFDQSITTFITKMDTLRLEKWNQILLKWKGENQRPPGTYTVAEAFDDLQEYGRCGTLDAALRDVAAKTNADNSKAVKANEEIKNIPSIDEVLKNTNP